jgi:RNA polymerase sigma-70 factor (ECF subfamily)
MLSPAVAPSSLKGAVGERVPETGSVPVADGRDDAAAADRVLMLRLRERDVDALEQLYERHVQAALGLAWRIVRDRGLAEDIVQEAFLTLWRQPERFDPCRGTARGWLLAIVHHRSIDHVRRMSTAGRAVELGTDLVDYRVIDPSDLAVDAIQREQVRAALECLPAEQREAIELSFLHGRTHQEIAELLHCPLGTVKGRIRIGLEKLRAFMLVPEHAVA